MGWKRDFQRNPLQTSTLERLGLDFGRFWDRFLELFPRKLLSIGELLRSKIVSRTFQVRAPKTFPRRPQDGPRRPKTAQDGPRTALRRPQDAPRRPQEALRRVQEAQVLPSLPRRPQIPAGRPNSPPRPPKRPTRHFREVGPQTPRAIPKNPGPFPRAFLDAGPRLELDARVGFSSRAKFPRPPGNSQDPWALPRKPGHGLLRKPPPKRLERAKRTARTEHTESFHPRTSSMAPSASPTDQPKRRGRAVIAKRPSIRRAPATQGAGGCAACQIQPADSADFLPKSPSSGRRDYRPPGILMGSS